MKFCVPRFFIHWTTWCALAVVAQFDSRASTLNPGDIVYADSGNAVDGGFIIKIDAATGVQTVVSSGGNLLHPFDVAIDAAGQIFVSDSGRLIEIEATTGRQTVITNQPGASLGSAYGIDIEPSGDVVAANALNVVRWDATSRGVEIVSSGRYLTCPMAVAVIGKDELIVADSGAPAQVVRVNARNGSQKVLSRQGFLKRPQSIAVQGKDIYVTDVATSDGNFGIGRIIHINASNGRQSVVAEGGFLVGPVGIAIESDGSLVVGDPYTINPNNHELYDGAIISVDPLNGRQTLITRGQGTRVNPRGVAIVPRFAHKERRGT
ncbi:MAG: hypothetical protein QOF48_2253 [Verrucomicrobiota bacterium]|jgi:DNA-binding beta-propeller fold protein YncE